MKKTLSIIFISLFAAASAFAQDEVVVSNSSAMEFSSIVRDPVSAAMGGNNAVTTSSAAWSTFGNPAALPYSSSVMDVAVAYQKWQPTTTNNINAGAGFNINNRFGISLGFAHDSGAKIDMFDNTGSSTGSFSPSNMIIGAGLSYRFLDFLSVGANVKYLKQNLVKDSSLGGVSADVFAMSHISDFNFTLGVSSLGGKVKGDDGQSWNLPTSIVVGAGYETIFNEKHGIEANLQGNYYYSDPSAFTMGVGAAYTFDRLVSLRAGYHYGSTSVLPSHLSLGAGVCFKGLHLDLAYLMASSEIGGTLALALGYRF